jgi:hypothetical protein
MGLALDLDGRMQGSRAVIVAGMVLVTVVVVGAVGAVHGGFLVAIAAGRQAAPMP